MDLYSPRLVGSVMKWILFLFFLTVGSDTSPFDPAIQTWEFSSKDVWDRALKELASWAEKT